MVRDPLAGLFANVGQQKALFFCKRRCFFAFLQKANVFAKGVGQPGSVIWPARRTGRTNRFSYLLYLRHLCFAFFFGMRHYSICDHWSDSKAIRVALFLMLRRVNGSAGFRPAIETPDFISHEKSSRWSCRFPFLHLTTNSPFC